MSDQNPRAPAPDTAIQPQDAPQEQDTTTQEQGNLPPDRWYPDLKSDSTDYLDRDEPTYTDGPLFSDEERAAATQTDATP